MESFPLFFKIRAATFVCMMLFSFLWLVLLCVEMFTRWSVADHISQSLMILFVLINTITLLMLPLLILVKFRIWLDTARLLLLFILQVGSATAGTVWSPKVKCPNQTPDDVGVCQLIDVYTMIACWVIPAILVLYSTYFAVTVYLQSRIPVVVEPKAQNHHSGDVENGSADSLSWAKRIEEMQGSNSEGDSPPRSLTLPAMVQARQSLPQFQRRSTLPEPPRHQSTMPPTKQQPSRSAPSMATRHYSLPAFKHGSRADLRPLIISGPLTASTSSNPHTPSSYTYSTPSPTNALSQSFNLGPSAADVSFPRGSSRHLSMMTPSSFPKEIQKAEGSSTPCSTRTRLSKPAPAYLM